MERTHRREYEELIAGRGKTDYDGGERRLRIYDLETRNFLHVFFLLIKRAGRGSGTRAGRCAGREGRGQAGRTRGTRRGTWGAALTIIETS